jgi:hypothetical protein
VQGLARRRSFGDVTGPVRKSFEERMLQLPMSFTMPAALSEAATEMSTAFRGAAELGDKAMLRWLEDAKAKAAMKGLTVSVGSSSDTEEGASQPPSPAMTRAWRWQGASAASLATANAGSSSETEEEELQPPSPTIPCAPPPPPPPPPVRQYVEFVTARQFSTRVTPDC